MNDLSIGIDFGTSYSSVAVFQHGEVKIVEDYHCSLRTPSYTTFTEREWFIGEDARNKATRNASSAVFEAKRLIGRTLDDHSVQNMKRRCPFEIKNDESNNLVVKVRVNKRTSICFLPEEFCSLFLRKINERLRSYLQRSISDVPVVITVPANFSTNHIQALKNACKIAGFGKFRFTNETSAAAVAYFWDKLDCQSVRNILVFNMGGGFTDVSIITITGPIFEVKSIARNAHLGGEDFTNRMVVDFVRKFKEQHDINLSSNSRALQRLRFACEEAKKMLSSHFEARILIDSLSDGLDFHLQISRSHFEGLNADLLHNILALVDTALENAGLDKIEIQEILLAGGSTHIPKIRQLLREYFDGKKLCRNIACEEAAVRGAAILAAERCHKVILLEVTRLSLGMRTEKGSIDVFPRSSSVMSDVWKLNCSTWLDKQTTIHINLYATEEEYDKQTNVLGVLTVSGIPKGSSHERIVKVKLRVDGNSVSSELAMEKTSGRHLKAVYVHSGENINDDILRRMLENSVIWKNMENERDKRVTAKDDLENYALELKSRLNPNVKQYKRLLEKIEEVLDWISLNLDANEEEYVNKRKELNNLNKPIRSFKREF